MAARPGRVADVELTARGRPAGVGPAAERLLESLDTWAARATQTVVAAIPSYRDHADELERSVRFTMRTFVDYASSGVPPGEAQLAQLGDVGRRRAEARERDGRGNRAIHCRSKRVRPS